jgi:alpha-glucoside transport system permease protein
VDRLLMAAVVVVGVPLITAGYIVLAERLLGIVPDKRRPAFRPWIWLAPALGLLSVFIFYPTLKTIVISFYDDSSTSFVGLANYLSVFTSTDTLDAIRNNLLWIFVFTPLTVGIGLAVAVLADRVKYESTIKAVFFLPMAVSFVAAGVIWKFMYDYQPPGAAQTGTLNAMVTSVGASPQPWLINAPWNNFFLIVVAIWTWVGFCMVIISAALKGIEPSLLEAARVDGANEWQVFLRVVVPLITPTLAVVATTMVIFALKAFDIVYVMTSGNFDTQVIAFTMYQDMFTFTQFGRAAAIAVVLMLATVPVMVFNISRFRAQEERR